jgi:hypothetical protein
MKAILNIGLKIDALGDDSPFNTATCYYARQSVAYRTLKAWGYDAERDVIKQSTTEHTSIIIVHDADSLLCTFLHDLADALAQDCIAVYYPEQDKGYLIGRNADKWGEFNKEYFLMP